MKTSRRFLTRAAGRAIATAFAVALVAVPALRAEDASASDAATTSTSQKVDFTLASPVNTMSFLKTEDASGSSSSSSSATPNTLMAERENLAEPFDPAQPPRRRTYGRPRYQDRMHNADGSTKIAFEVGGGFVNPVGSTGHYQTLGYNFSVGGGLNFNKAFGVLVQFDWDNMGIPRSILTGMQQAYIDSGYATSDDVAGLDGSTHLWSFTVNPVINFQGSGKAGAYITGGLGYYHKVTSFTLPGVSYYCDYYYGCYGYESNQEFDRYTSGALGLNAGVGFTYKVSNFSNMKLFAEAKYVWVNNDNNNNNQAVFYRPNGYRTGYIPVKFGIRY